MFWCILLLLALLFPSSSLSQDLSYPTVCQATGAKIIPGSRGSVASECFSSLNSAVTNIRVNSGNLNDVTAEQQTLVISSTMIAGATLSTPTQLGIEIRGQGAIDCQNQYTVTIRGPFTAPNRQVFVNCSNNLIKFGGRAFSGSITPLWWGALGNGTGDQTTALQASLNAVPTTHGGSVVWPAGDYITSSTLTFPVIALPVVLMAYGAIIDNVSTASAGPAIKIVGNQPGNTNYKGWSIYGLIVSVPGATGITYGVSVENTVHVSLYDVHVNAGNNASGFACLEIGQSVASDTSTGALWTMVYNFLCKRQIGSIPTGILIQGHSNSNTILGGQVSGGSITAGLKIADQSGGDGAIPNAVLVDGLDFETVTTNVLVTSATATAVIGGLRFIGNRSENVADNTFFSFTGITRQPDQAPLLMGNYMIRATATYLNNPNSLKILMLDAGTTGVAGGSVPDYGPMLIPYSGLLVDPTDAPETCTAALKGSLYFDASLNMLCFCNATNWCQVNAPATCTNSTSCG